VEGGRTRETGEGVEGGGGEGEEVNSPQVRFVGIDYSCHHEITQSHSSQKRHISLKRDIYYSEKIFLTQKRPISLEKTISVTMR